MIYFKLHAIAVWFLVLTVFHLQGKEVDFKVAMYVDSANKLGFEGISNKSPLFSAIQSHAPNLGNEEVTLWLKITLPKTVMPIILTVENAHIDLLSCYIVRDGVPQTYRVFHTGDHKLFFDRDIASNLFSFTIEPGESTVYLQAKTQGLLSVPLRVHLLYDYFNYDRMNQMAMWFFYGIAAVALMANLIFFLVLKDRVYLYYTLYVFANLIYSSVDVETTFQYLWPGFPWVNKLNVLFYASFVFILLFCCHFLEIKKHSKWHYRLYLVFIALFLGTGIYSLFDYRMGIQFFTYESLVMPFFLLTSGVFIYINSKNSIYLLFLVGWSIYLLGILIYIFAVMGLWEYNGSFGVIIPLASSFEMLVMFVTVIYKVNTIREDGTKAKNQVIDLLHEHENLLLEQNTVLEAKVQERTKMLQELNDDIMSQNEEITTQNEELYSQRETLELQSALLEEKSRIITRTNEQLSDYKEHLEQLVDRRTHELQKSNEALELRNEQMEQFSFMAAHNLRSPIASLLGLANLALENTGTNYMHIEIIKRIDLSVKKLDMVVRTLNNMLSDLNTAEKLMVAIDVAAMLEEVKGLLYREISESKAEIILDAKEGVQFDSIYAYMHNLFYNLIHNAIKYRQTAVPLQIKISVRQSSGEIALVFEDNGQGIDLEKFGPDLFKAFKRFNDTVDGIGIGLYLVKTQIQVLGGHISVQSRVNEGCAFTIVIPNAPPQMLSN